MTTRDQERKHLAKAMHHAYWAVYGSADPYVPWLSALDAIAEAGCYVVNPELSYALSGSEAFRAIVLKSNLAGPAEPVSLSKERE